MNLSSHAKRVMRFAKRPTRYLSTSDVLALMRTIREDPYGHVIHHGLLADALDEEPHITNADPISKLIRRQFGFGEYHEHGPRENLWYNPVENSWDGTFPYTARLGQHGPWNLYLGHERPDQSSSMPREGVEFGGPSNARWILHAVSHLPGLRDFGYTFEFPHEEANLIPKMFPQAKADHPSLAPNHRKKGHIFDFGNQAQVAFPDTSDVGRRYREAEARYFENQMDEEERNRG